MRAGFSPAPLSPFTHVAVGEADADASRAIEGQGTSEARWLAWLDQSPPPIVEAGALVAAGGRAVVVAPHPDDEILAVGGLLTQLSGLGREVLIVAVTDGTGSHKGSTLWPRERLRRERPRETRRALRRLGLEDCETRRLGLPDGGLTRSRSALTRHVASLLRPLDTLFTTWRLDGHPDHEAAGQACAAAATSVGVALVEVPVWAWHWASPGDARLPWSRARRVLLDAGQSARKVDAVAAFRSQLVPDPSTGAGPILRGTTVERARRPFEVLFA
jgi:LmbE family N-acetylglucosaminyl deacetylase